MTTNESVTSNKTGNYQSIGFIGLIKLSVLSMITGILLGELLYWMLINFSIFILQRFNNDFSDSGSMFLGIFLGFYLKPVMSGVITMVSFFILLKRSKMITHKNLHVAFETALMFALAAMLSIIASLIVSASEAKIPLTNLSEIYLLFIR